MESAALLETKLFIPSRRTNLVDRPRLANRLSSSIEMGTRLTLVSARAGSGKTTLVSAWLVSQAHPYAWLSLESADNDPRRFTNYLFAAFRRIAPSIASSCLDPFEVDNLPPVETVFTCLVNELAASLTGPSILVLDDVHLIQNDWIHQALGFLVEHQPALLHLVLLTRVDPPLPLARLRARSQLTEIRDQDLLFDVAETAEFLNKVMKLDLTPDIINRFSERTEGWIAGLQMAAISASGYRQRNDLASFVQAFSGTNRFILDYLLDEVLDQQPRAIQDFLIETSILDRLCADLCDAVRTGNEPVQPSAEILAYLEKANLFLIPLDDEKRWYRYHQLFADLLQSTLSQKRTKDQIQELHRRAGLWLWKNGFAGEAVDHLMESRDFDRAADVIEKEAARLIHLFSRTNHPLILEWIERLPEEVRRSRPWLDLVRADMLVLNLEPEKLDPILSEVEKRVESGSLREPRVIGHIEAVRAYAANLRGQADTALRLAKQARDHLAGSASPLAQALTTYALSDTAFAVDDLAEAEAALHEMARIGEESGQMMMSVLAECDLAAVRKAQGSLTAAGGLYASAFQRLSGHGSLDTRVRCSYEFGVADLLRERNQLDDALAHARAGIELRSRLGGYQVVGDLALLGVLQARRDFPGGLEALQTAERSMNTLPFPLALTIEFKVARALFWLAAGDLDAAERYAAECTNCTEREQLMKSRLLLAKGQMAQAVSLLQSIVTRSREAKRNGRLIEALALLAAGYEIAGAHADADSTLWQSVQLAFPEGFRRSFIDLKTPLFDVLTRLETRSPVDRQLPISAYVHELTAAMDHESLAGVPSASGAQSTGPLTARELDVLRLVAEGFSNKEIADRMVVAPSTIKQHLKNISTKLDVHGRMQAIARARELNLL